MDKKRRKIKELIESENKLKGDIVRKQEKYGQSMKEAQTRK